MPYTNISFANLKTLLRARLQNSLFYTDIEIAEFLNECFSLLQIGSLYWKSRFQAQSVAGLVFYDLSSLAGTLDDNGNPQILMPLRVAFNQSPLDFCAISDLDNGGISNWQTQTTATAGAPDVPQLWGTVGLNFLYLWPSDAVGGNDIQLDCAVRAPHFATDGSDDALKVNIESGMIPAMLDYCQHIAQIKRGAGQIAATMPKLKSFFRLIAQTNSMFAASSIFKESYALQTERKARTRGDITGVPTPARFR